MSLTNKKTIKIFLGLIVLPALLFSLYTWASLNWVYSSGERAGYVQKFSLKGYLCKTWEGEIILVSMPGTQAEKFLFTVQDEAVAKKLNDSMGLRVKIHYQEHKGIPSSCFGETAYFVDDLIVLEK
jgi:hypothetical protein